MAVYSGSSIQNTNNRRFLIWKNKCIIDLINNQPDIDKIHLYAKDPYKAKYQFLINKRESRGLKHFNGLKLLLSIQMICKMFIKILKNTI